MMKYEPFSLLVSSESSDRILSCTERKSPKEPSPSLVDSNGDGLTLAILSGLVGLGIVLRVYCLGSKNLWLDEMWSLVIARMPLHSVLWSARTQDPNAALYNMLLHFWIRLGQSEGVLRGLSLICGVALIPALFQLGKRLFHTSVGLIASALATFNLFHIQYSQEARAYSLVVILVTLSSLCFVECVERPSARAWTSYVFLSALAVYAHIFAVLVLFAHIISMVSLPRQSVPRRGLFVGSASIALLTIPLWILVYDRTRSPFISFNWIPRPNVRRIYDLFYSLAGNANYYGREIHHHTAGKVLFIACSLICLMTLTAASDSWRFARYSRRTWRSAYLFIWMLFPIVAVLGFSLLVQSWFINRYLLICLPASLIIVAKGIHLIQPKWLSVACLAVIILLQVAGLPQYYRYRQDYQEWKAATDYIVTTQRPGDAVVFSVAHGRLLFEYYRDRYYMLHQRLDIIYPDLRNTETDPQALSYFPPLHAAQLAAVTTAHPRVWLVLYPDEWAPKSPTSQQLQKTLAAAYPQVHETRVYTVILRLYAKDDNDSRVRARVPCGVSTIPGTATYNK